MAAMLFIILAVVVFSGLGILSASFVMILKRGSPISWILNWLSWLLGGVLYPVTILPEWLRQLSLLLPITYVIEGMRAALIGAAAWSELWHSLGPLIVFALTIIPLAILSFYYATRRARVTGTLPHY